MLKAVIIDDNKTAIKSLVVLLTNNSITKIKISGTALNLTAGVEIIKKTHPDMVFLEVNLSERNGLQIYKLFKSPSFKIIFCAENHQYAIDILKKSPCGYLIKPYKKIDLQKTLYKISDELLTEQKQLNLENRISLESCPITTGVNILLEVANGFIIVNTRNIEYFYAKDPFSVVVMSSEKELLIHRSLKDLQTLIAETLFYKQKKTCLTNIYYTRKFVSSKENYMIMERGFINPISVRSTATIAKYINGKMLK